MVLGLKNNNRKMYLCFTVYPIRFINNSNAKQINNNKNFEKEPNVRRHESQRKENVDIKANVGQNIALSACC